jgi:NADH-quinone oxidoreductase subunit F
MGKLKNVEEFDLLRKSIIEERDPAKICVTICGGTGCSAWGSDVVREAFIEELRKRGLEEKIDVKNTGCHGFCERGPVVVILPQEIFYQQMLPDDVPEVVSETLINGNPVRRLLYADPVTGRKCVYEHEVPFYKKQMRIVLDDNGRIDPTRIRDYIARDGYKALERVLSQTDPEEVVETVERSGLRGRGGAGFPTGRKWRLARQAPGDEKYIICNADEGDPGAFMDRSVLEGNPHSVVEGMIIAGYAIGAGVGYVYVRAEYPLGVKHLRIALSQAEELGLLGKDILGSGLDFEIRIKEGAGAFVCGEETGLIASIEGSRSMPRPRPPFPAQSGLWGKPTNINNVETYANIRHIFARGSGWFASMGTDKSKGTKIFSLTGKVNNTGLVEVPIGIKVRDVVFSVGGGIPREREFKAVQMGGPSGGCVPSQYLDLPIDYESLEKIGAIMGSGGMVVMDDGTCMVDIARFFLNFTQSESCGKCVPCRVGTKRMLETLTRITEGEGKEEDIDLLVEVGKKIKDSALCGLGQTAPNPVLSTIRYFRNEYEDHIRRKHCKAATCEALVYAPCEHVCPVNVDAVGYISLIAQRRYEDALHLERQRNPLAGICGRACTHPCETHCRRGDVDEPIAISALKRFVADYGMKRRVKTVVSKETPKKKKVAIVGSGPAGLNAGYHLARKGYPVTIFEALPVVGGMMSVGIPEYRLPRNVIEFDVDFIRSVGVEVKTNAALGSQFTLEDLRRDGYEAVFLATGDQEGIRLGVPGEELDGVLEGVSFLRALNLKEKVAVGDRVVVIGGGNVAIDAARSSLRLGARKVSLVYRRTKVEMPAIPEEIEDAIREGIEFIFLAAPKAALGGNGKVQALECLCMELGDFDASGRRRPISKEGSEFTIEADTIIPAIGQRPSVAYLSSDDGIQVGKGQTIQVDPVTLATTRAGVFAGGDVVTGAATIVEALGQGEEAAVSMDGYLRGEDVTTEHLRPAETRLFLPKVGGEDEEMHEVPRVRIPHRPVARRVGSFEEVVRCYSAGKAYEEALRCLRCDLER